ncbi:putative membrane protein [Acinetobacter baumannii 1571545]|nr:putative membrane protein [Acinetobacter sp. 21871]EXR66115.1 putative membrane protein [Acinetobacter sp. 1424608]EXS47073.1 putative membrane protein [Acinetobacter sp. 88816]KCY47117.1 putative membrane protein [Acinetobacter baumannii 1571545]
MDIWKFLKSFNTVNTYLMLSTMLLILLVLYFYVINPT